MAVNLARAWVLGLVRAEEALHAARQLLVARLQRLVVHAGHGSSNTSSRPEQQREVYMLEGPHLVQLATDAQQAAAAGHQQRAVDLLGEIAALHLQHQQQRADRCSSAASCAQSEMDSSGAGGVPASFSGPVHSLLERMSEGVPIACDGRGNPACHQVHSTLLLAAWVRARERLQQLPQEVAAAVVAAVKKAQQQQQQEEAGEVKAPVLPTYQPAIPRQADMAAACQAAAVAAEADKQQQLPSPPPQQQTWTETEEAHQLTQQQRTKGTQAPEVPIMLQRQHHKGTQTKGLPQQLYDAQQQMSAQQPRHHHQQQQQQQQHALVQPATQPVQQQGAHMAPGAGQRQAHARTVAGERPCNAACTGV
jgi:hypothetical protein